MTARRRLAIGVGVALAVAGICIANAHLVIVALDSQSACVPHARPGEAEGGFGAAQSSC